jgi:hypothetical protein
MKRHFHHALTSLGMLLILSLSGGAAYAITPAEASDAARINVAPERYEAQKLRRAQLTSSRDAQAAAAQSSSRTKADASAPGPSAAKPR